MCNATDLQRHTTALFESWIPEAGDGEADLRQLIGYAKQVSTAREVTPFAPSVVDDWLGQCCAQSCQPQHRAVVDAILDFSSRLRWYSPASDYAGEEMSKNYAFTRLIGPQLFGEDSAIFYSDTVTVGFTVQAPNIHYPSHWHPAAECYGVLTGTGRWQVNHEPFTEKPPGTFIYHPTNIPHAMETLDQPMLTVYGWTGAINVRPVANI